MYISTLTCVLVMLNDILLKFGPASVEPCKILDAWYIKGLQTGGDIVEDVWFVIWRSFSLGPNEIRMSMFIHSSFPFNISRGNMVQPSSLYPPFSKPTQPLIIRWLLHTRGLCIATRCRCFQASTIGYQAATGRIKEAL